MRVSINALVVLLKTAKMLGLKDDDLENATDFLNHHEFELCFDTVVTQMYEYEIEIDKEFYKLVDQIGKKLNLPRENYSFMEELIRDGHCEIPTSVKDELTKTISSLK